MKEVIYICSKPICDLHRLTNSHNICINNDAQHSFLNPAKPNL